MFAIVYRDKRHGPWELEALAERRSLAYRSAKATREQERLMGRPTRVRVLQLEGEESWDEAAARTDAEHVTWPVTV